MLKAGKVARSLKFQQHCNVENARPGHLCREDEGSEVAKTGHCLRYKEEGSYQEKVSNIVCLTALQLAFFM